MTTTEDVARLAALRCEIVEGDLRALTDGIDSLSGLGTIRELTGSLQVEQSHTQGSNLASIELPALQVVSGTIGFVLLTSPETLQLASLETVGGRFTITSNDALASIQMDALTSVTDLVIVGNSNLLTLHGLPSLSEADSLFIASNPKLPQCEVDAIDRRVDACSTCNENDRQAVCE